MINSQLSKKDYEKIFEFITGMQTIQTDFGYLVLKNLSKIFGYNYLTFFLSDKKGKFINPVATNISPALTKIYTDYYHSTDIFHPIKIPNLLYKKNAISITDIMPYSQFENTEYYKDFLHSINLYYEIAVPLKIGNNIIGGIGIFNPKESGDFTSKDILILSKLNEFISNNLNNFIQTKHISYEQKILTNMTSQAPVGLVVLNNSYSIIYSNNTAENFCMNILNGKLCLNPIQSVITELLAKGTLKKNDSSPFLNDSINNYNFKINSTIELNAFKKFSRDG